MTLIMREAALCKCENKVLTSIRAKNMCMYIGCQQIWAIQMLKIRKSGHSYTFFFFFFKKRGVYHIYSGAEKGDDSYYVMNKDNLRVPPSHD